MRNYKREYKIYHSKPKQVKRRVARNKARRVMIKMGKVKKYSSMDVDHKNKNPLDNRLNNLRVISKYKNRSIK